MADFDAKTQLSGLAGEIRAQTTSDNYDLGGYTELRATDLMKSTFSSPMTEPDQMVKFQFVVGGGKLVRSKYDDNLCKWIIAALRDIGFSEDRSAAETFDSQGTFKQQHDTGQNLKYLIVYPHVTCASAGEKGSSEDADAVVIMDTTSPEYIACACESSTFKDMVGKKVVSYKQKKCLLQILQTSADRFKAIEEKLFSGILLSPSEQAVYDANNGTDAEKIVWLQGEIKIMVDEGRLTRSEKNELSASIAANIETITKEIEEATAEGKPKKVEKLLSKRDASTKRKEVVEKNLPFQHRLAQSDHIQKLYMRLFPLQVLEDKGRSCSLTLADLTTLGDKSDIEDAIHSYEYASRGWFQEDADFEKMCEMEEKEARTKQAGKKGVPAKKASSSGGSLGTSKFGGSSAGRAGVASSGSGWGTVGNKKSSGPAPTAAKKSTQSGFAAAFAGSDSD
jgi:hypothetical protein